VCSSDLGLSPQGQQPQRQSESIPVENPADNVGYSNIQSIEKPNQEERVQIPTPEESMQVEKPLPEEQRGYSNLEKHKAEGEPQPKEPEVIPPDSEGKTWTVGRRKQKQP
jgi:hypothetical protein